VLYFGLLHPLSIEPIASFEVPAVRSTTEAVSTGKRGVGRPMKWSSPEITRILVLADLHYTADPESTIETVSHGGSKLKGAHSNTNIKRLFDFLVQLVKDVFHSSIDHVIILGDLTRNGRVEEFKMAEEGLLFLQKQLFSSREEVLSKPSKLAGECFTIIPGNHDLAADRFNPVYGMWRYIWGYVRWRLGLFRSGKINYKVAY
jgi:3',5'-cyclic AMP phosphodiesterase CpdA